MTSCTKNIVKWHVRDLEAVFNGAIRALAKAGVFGKQVTGIADGTDLETTERYRGCGQVTRQVRIEDKRGKVHEIEVTVYGWKVLLLIDAVTKIPLAVTVGQVQEHEALWARALVTQARANLAGEARLAKVVFDKGFLDGPTLWWLDQQGLRFVVPAKTNMAVTVDARAQAAAGEVLTLGRRVHTVRHGQGKAAWTERLETEVVGITGLTTYDQYGAPEQARQAHRRDFQANPINAVVVRRWRGKDYGLGGKTVFLTNAPVEKPLQVFDDDDDRSLIENCCIKAAKQPWELGYPPQKNARAVRVHVVFTLLLFALATAYRLQGEREAMGGKPVGWQRWRRQLLEQTRDQVIVFADGYYGIFHLAEYSLLLGVKLKGVPPGVGSRQQVLAKYKVTARG
jgi:Transposase DDE domain